MRYFARLSDRVIELASDSRWIEYPSDDSEVLPVSVLAPVLEFLRGEGILPWIQLGNTIVGVATSEMRLYVQGLGLPWKVL